MNLKIGMIYWNQIYVSKNLTNDFVYSNLSLVLLSWIYYIGFGSSNEYE